MARSCRSQITAALLLVGLIVPFAGMGSETGDCVRFGVLGDSRIVVPVYVNGQGPYRFMLDTGAEMTVVDDSIARRLGLRAITFVRLGNITGVSPVTLASIESLGLGNRTARGMRILVGDLSRIYSLPAGIQGLLGQDFLSKFNYLLRLDRRTVCFDNAGEIRSRLQGEALPAERRNSRSYVMVPGSDGSVEPLRFLLDSGCPYLILWNNRSAIEKLGLVPFRMQTVVIRSGAGQRVFEVCRVTGFRISGASLRDLKVMLGQLLPGEERFEDGFLPLNLFDAVYFNNEEGYVILNPRFAG